MSIIKNNITEKLLGILAIAGILSLAVVAPNVVGVIGRPKYRKWRFDQKKYRRSLDYLKRKKSIDILQKDGANIVELTRSGKAHAFRYYIDNLTIKKPKIWDRLWRIVIFDIPNIKKLGRDTLRDKLRELGFYKLQESVFVYPYNCQNEIELLKDVYQIKSFVRFIVAKRIDREREILEYFDLKC